MKRRCQNPNADAYKDYGGRGIAVCDAWQTFEGFYRCIGDAPAGKTLGRIENDGNYEPGNVQWEDWKQQNRNRRSSRFYEYQGKRQTLGDWSDELKMPRRLLRWRIEIQGMPVDAAMAMPYKPYRKRAKKV